MACIELILPVPAEEDDLEGARGVEAPLDLRAEARAAPQYEIALVLRPSVVVPTCRCNNRDPGKKVPFPSDRMVVMGSPWE